jgi:hypothetical protein
LDRRLGDLTTGLDDFQKRKFITLPGLELRPLVRLRYPGSVESVEKGNKK